MTFIVTAKTRSLGTRFPTGPFSLNKDSAQARGLAVWYPVPRVAGNAQGSQDWLNRATTAPAYHLQNSGTPGTNEILSDSERGAVFNKDLTVNPRYQVLSTPVTGMPLTICAWAYSNQDNATGQHIVNLGQDGSNNHRYTIGKFANTDEIFATAKTTAASQALTTVACPVGEWVHACGVFTSNISRAAYLNGGNKGSSSTNRSPNASDSIKLGTAPNQVTPFNGRISDVRIYDRALTDAEVYALYDPATRWELYWQPRRTYFIPAAAGGLSIPVAQATYRRLRQGT